MTYNTPTQTAPTSSMGSLLYSKLPKVYREEDEKLTGNKPLYRFLQLLGMAFDIAKADMDGAFNLLDVNKCPDKYLPYLAQSLGIEFPYDMTSDEQRRFIKSASLIYQQKGTIPAFQFMARELTGQQFQATIVENRDWVVKTNSIQHKTFSPTQQLGTSSSTVSYTPGPQHNKKVFTLFLTANADTQNVNNTYNRLSQLAQYFAPAGTTMISTIVYYFLDTYNAAQMGETYMMDKLIESNTESVPNNQAETYNMDIVMETQTEKYSTMHKAESAFTNTKQYLTNNNFYTNAANSIDKITNINTGRVTYQIS